MISVFQRFSVSGFRSALWLAPLAWLWGVLLNDLRVEWTVNPQYSYGWAVPFLCLFLLARNARSRLPAPGSPLPAPLFPLFCWLLALLYLPARLIQEANPGWRLISWALALEVVGLTLGWLWLFQQAAARNPQPATSNGGASVPASRVPALRSPLSAPRFQVSGLKFPWPVKSAFSLHWADFVFPLGFFLVAVPWPTGLENFLIQGLTRLDVQATCELAGWCGIPTVPHGNVIEVATGQVGIDEACSGIRSFQATLMISLFLGEFYRLSGFRRWALCFVGFALAVLLNLVRQTVLVWVAASQGVPAIAQWHDPTGVIILLGCFCGLWGAGVWLARGARGGAGVVGQVFQPAVGRNPEAPKPRSTETPPPSALQPPVSWAREGEATSPGRPSAFRLPHSALALTAWLVLVELGVEGWYRWHEARLPAPVTWQVAWPVAEGTFKDLAFAPVTREILRYDTGRNAVWQEAGLNWQVTFLQWNPGRAAVRLAQNHTPEICLAAAGHQLSGGDALVELPVHGLKLPFRFYQLTDTASPVFVAYCLWEDRAATRDFSTRILTRAGRLAPVLAGERNAGQRSLELAVSGVANETAARAAVQQLLEQILVPSP